MMTMMTKRVPELVPLTQKPAKLVLPKRKMQKTKKVAKQVLPTQKQRKVAKLVLPKRKMQKTKKVAKQVLPTQKPKKVAKLVPLKRKMQKTKKVAKQVLLPPTQKPKKAAKKMLQNLKTTSQSPKKSHLKKQTLAKKSQPAKRQQLVPLRVPPLAHLAQALRHCVGISRIVKHLSKMTTKFVDYLALLWPILWGSLHDLKTYRKLNICVY